MPRFQNIPYITILLFFTHLALTPSTRAEAPTTKAENFKPYTATIPGTKITFDMVPIPAGKFLMGSPATEKKRSKNEGPQHPVKVAPFWMGKYEVTWAEYKYFMSLYNPMTKMRDYKLAKITNKNRADTVTIPTPLYDPEFTYNLGESARHPAASMTQFAAKQYCKMLTHLTGQFHRLPTEAEWEYACRAGTTTAYHFGDDPDKLGDYAWYFDNSEFEPNEPNPKKLEAAYRKVGLKKPNPWGLYDMHGNVAEWVMDDFKSPLYKQFAGKGPRKASLFAKSKKEFPRCMRGGSWDHDPHDCRSASRIPSNDKEWKIRDPNSPRSPWWYTEDRSLSVGFRIVRPVNPPPKSEWNLWWNADVDDIQYDVKERLRMRRAILGLIDKKLPQTLQKLARLKSKSNTDPRKKDKK